MGLAGSAREYLNAPIDTWLTFQNIGYSTSVTWRQVPTLSAPGIKGFLL
jgi:hypothetical protein